VETIKYSDNVPFYLFDVELSCTAILGAYSTGYMITILDEFAN